MPACTIQQEEKEDGKRTPYLHQHPYPMDAEQYQRFLGTLDFAIPQWEQRFVLTHGDDGCVVSKSTYGTMYEIQGAIKVFLAMDEPFGHEASLPCRGEVQ